MEKDNNEDEGLSLTEMLQQTIQDGSDYSTILGPHLDSITEDSSNTLGPHLDSISEDFNTYNVTDESNLPTADEMIVADIQIQEEGKCFDIEQHVALQVDTSHSFTTDTVFKTELEATNWLDNVGRRVGMVFVRGRSDYSKGRNPYIKYVCERGGDMRVNHHGKAKASATHSIPKQKIKPRKSNSKKCGCLFLIKLKYDKKVDGWSIIVVNGIHNHSLNAAELGHAFKGRLKADEKAMVAKLTKLGILPKFIRQELKEKNPLNCTPAQTIYNERVKLKKQLREDRSVMQELFHLAEKEKDGVFIRYTKTEKGEVENLFWARKKPLVLLRMFPHVLLIDCTYKTNFYKLPLFHVVGVTYTNKTFTVANAYLWAEKKVNYKWVMEQLRIAIQQSEGAIPTTIVTDRDLALMDSVGVVFPEADNLLCRWHIEKAVLAKVRPKRKQAEVNQILDAWKKIVWSETEDDLYIAMNEMKALVDDKIMQYLESTWLSKYKERFVSVWTNNFFHLGSTETQRVESAHSSLKQWLGTSNCDLVIGWNAIKSMCEDQWVKIIESFELSRIKWPTAKLNEKWSRYLRGNMAMHAIEKLNNEMERIHIVGESLEMCGCVLRKTYGLPCAHELSTMLKQSGYIPRTSLHRHWRKLDIEWSPCENDEDHTIDPYLNDFVVAYDLAPSPMAKLEFIQRLREATYPSSTSLSQPPIKLNPKGRPRTTGKRKAKNDWTDDCSTKRMPSLFEFVEEEASKAEALEKVEALKKADECNDYNINIVFVHEKYRDYVQSIKDVKGDGNCGYRSVAVALGRSEEEFRNIRQELVKELSENEVLYDKILKLRDGTKELIANVDWKGGSCVPRYWMELPTMLWCIAEVYNCVAVMLSVGKGPIYNLSCLPTRHPPTQVPPRVICVLNRCKHFVCVTLKKDCPLPRVIHGWSEHAKPDVRDAWMDIVSGRLDAGKTLFDHKIVQNELVVIDD